ncbi:MAG: transcriptional repressor [Candidatus Latescibacterota bacterium]|jgi:Fur family peroxide stress response transcriptional regulator
MDHREKQDRVAQFEDRCREAGLPVTFQRRAILEAVLESDLHPTANQVYEAVKSVSRGVSRATVHRNLEIMAGMGVITRTSHPGGVARYDGRTDIHHHLICLSCNSVVDIDDDHLNSLKIPDTSSFGFEVSDFRVQLRGVCRDCKAKDSKRRRNEKRSSRSGGNDSGHGS